MTSLRRQNGHGSHLQLVRTIGELERVASTRTPTLDERAAQEKWWTDFHAAAPAPVWDFVMCLDAELSQSRPTDVDEWLEQHHPAFENVVEGLHYAFRAQLGMDARLRYVQGTVVKYAEWRLGWAFARDRQPLTGGVWNDHVVQQLAADALLAWTHADSHAAWLEPDRFLGQWRMAGTTDASVLERAGLHAAELELLAATR